jgi:hypothetical protein
MEKNSEFMWSPQQLCEQSSANEDLVKQLNFFESLLFHEQEEEILNPTIDEQVNEKYQKLLPGKDQREIPDNQFDDFTYTMSLIMRIEEILKIYSVLASVQPNTENKLSALSLLRLALRCEINVWLDHKYRDNYFRVIDSKLHDICTKSSQCNAHSSDNSSLEEAKRQMIDQTDGEGQVTAKKR